MLWLGLAFAIRNLRPPAKISRLQTLIFVFLSLLFFPAYLALVALILTSQHTLVYSAVGSVEGIAIWAMIYTQLRAKIASGTTGAN